ANRRTRNPEPLGQLDLGRQPVADTEPFLLDDADERVKNLVVAPPLGAVRDHRSGGSAWFKSGHCTSARLSSPWMLGALSDKSQTLSDNVTPLAPKCDLSRSRAGRVHASALASAMLTADNPVE